jgi:hypothetical protein
MESLVTYFVSLWIMEFGTPSLPASACIMSILVQLSSFVKEWTFDKHLRQGTTLMKQT